MTSSTYAISVAFPATVTANTNILTTPITFGANDFDPGGAATIRVWFTFTAALDMEVSVSSDAVGAGFNKPEKFNADNNFTIKSDSKYRFDIDVLPGDSINLRSNQALTAIQKLRFQVITFGA